MGAWKLVHMRTELATVAVVSLLVVAGCSAFGGETPTATTVSPTTAAPAEPTTTAETATQLYDAPLETEAVVTAHEAALRDAGTFRLNSTVSRSQGNQSGTVSSSIAGSLETNELVARQHGNQQVIETYADGNGSAYQRLTLAGNHTRYRTLESMPTATQLVGADARSSVAPFQFEYVGTDTISGTATDVYAANGTADLNESAPAFDGLELANVSSASARLYVAESGLLKQLEYSVTWTAPTGDEHTVTGTHRYTEVGTMTVDEPAWVETARANTTA